MTHLIYLTVLLLAAGWAAWAEYRAAQDRKARIEIADRMRKGKRG